MEPEYEQGPFGLLYEAWVASGPRGQRDPALERQIAETYRDAWVSGLTYERTAVLHSILDRRDSSSASLVVDGIRSDDHYVASTAATIALVGDGLGYLTFGPDLRPAFRDLVRRFPENDRMRPRRLYGHESADVDDTADRPFVNLYEDWMADEYPRNDEILRQLVETYRDAWANGDGVDRAFVLHFICSNGRPANPALAVDGLDLVIEALESDDAVLAPTAGSMADFYVSRGNDLGPLFRAALEKHLQHFPSRRSPAAWALRKLQERDAENG